MIWLEILRGLFSFGTALAKHLNDKKLIDAGRYETIALYNKCILEEINKARMAVARAKSDPKLADKLRERYNLDK